MPREMAKHLIHTYGTYSKKIVEAGKEAGMLERIHADYPFCEAEILHSIKNEMAQKPNDIACRRVPVAFLDTECASTDVLPRVTEIMGKHFGWSADQCKAELEEARKNLAYNK